jgi:hypothetical protein
MARERRELALPEAGRNGCGGCRGSMPFAIRTSAISTLMVRFSRLVNIAAMAIRCMPVDAKHFPSVRSGSTCGGTLSEKRKDRKILFFYYGNHFEEIRIWIRFSVNPDSEQSLTKTKIEELRQSPNTQTLHHLPKT